MLGPWTVYVCFYCFTEYTLYKVKLIWHWKLSETLPSNYSIHFIVPVNIFYMDDFYEIPKK